MRHTSAARVDHVWHNRGSLSHRVSRYVFDRFLLLPLGAAIALVWANTAPESYFEFAHRLAFPVNEIGMAFFFALITQEVRESLMPGGALHSWRKWSLPVVAAAGGVAGAVFVYLGYVQAKYQAVLTPGWPIAVAIDAVAAYYVVKLILPRSPAVPFALLLAIVSDIFGMFVVGPRHVVLEMRIGGVILVLAGLGLAGLFRARKVRRFWPYLGICGPLLWMAFYWEGLHPALSLMPIVFFLPHEPRRGDVFRDPPDDDPIHHAEHEWNEFVQLAVFMFGLVNAGVVLRDYYTGTWAMLAASLVGRPVGILVATGIAVLVGLHLPRRIGWREIVVVALASSSGFMVALFFATGMLAIGPTLAQLKIGVLLSAAGAPLAIGAGWLLKVGRFSAGADERRGRQWGSA
jgi:NhaA family Na+:H+ antiporter